MAVLYIKDGDHIKDGDLQKIYRKTIKIEGKKNKQWRA